MSNYNRPFDAAEFGRRLYDVKKRMGEAGFDPVYGARPLKRAIQSRLENPLAEAILSGRFAPGAQVRVDVDGDQLVFATQADSPAPTAKQQA